MEKREENIAQLSMCLDVIDDAKDDVKKLIEKLTRYCEKSEEFIQEIEIKKLSPEINSLNSLKNFFIIQILILNLIKKVAGKVGFEPTNFSFTILTFNPFDATVNHDYCLQRITTTAIIFLKTSCPLWRRS